MFSFEIYEFLLEIHTFLKKNIVNLHTSIYTSMNEILYEFDYTSKNGGFLIFFHFLKKHIN